MRSDPSTSASAASRPARAATRDRGKDLVIDLSAGLAALGLTQRLADTPPSAHVRGVFFRLAERALAESAPHLAPIWRVATGWRPRWAFKMYPTRELIREQAVAAVLLDAANPGRVLRQMWASIPKLPPHVGAEAFMRYLAKGEPMRALGWLNQNRRIMCDYGDWWVVPSGTSSATFHYKNEYIWIEHCHVGGCEETIRRSGRSPTVIVDLDSPYCGRLHLSWK